MGYGQCQKCSVEGKTKVELLAVSQMVAGERNAKTEGCYRTSKGGE